ncbi:MAG: shikimate dehydrogenase [Gammaproteobacteria bacterium]|nr:shikimate dehydrogenase [Gammaproteobacteria bacterium]
MNLDLRVNGSTKLTGLIGNPVEHTVSPVLQNSLFSATGTNGIYLPLRVPEGYLGDAVKGLKSVGFTGFNVTIPYKGAIMEYLDEVSEEAELLEAVNTVKLEGDRLIGYNTDADGFLRAFSEQTNTGFAQKKVCILGAGGTARTLAIKIALEGADKICIINRTLSNAKMLADKINKVMSRQLHVKKTDTCDASTVTAAAAGSPESDFALEECDIIINATSVGMHPNTDFCPLEERFSFRPEQIIYDVIYNPIETKLMALARRSGCIVVNGAGMLFYQGVKAFEIWMGPIIAEEKLEEISNEFLKYLLM